MSPFADPYLNTDAGTMSPFEHGEVFVLDDGGEARAATFSELRAAGTTPFSSKLILSHEMQY